MQTSMEDGTPAGAEDEMKDDRVDGEAVMYDDETENESESAAAETSRALRCFEHYAKVERTRKWGDHKYNRREHSQSSSC